MIRRIFIHNFPVTYEENASEGLRHLKDDLDINESRVFFEQAKKRGSAQFEDDEDREYTLFYKNGAFTLVRR